MGKEESEAKAHDSVPWWTSCRVTLAILGFFGFINVYALRVNMSVAIVCMVNQTALRSNEDNSSSNNSHTRIVSSSCDPREVASSNITNAIDVKDGIFVWNKSTQGIILGSFFWGYLLTQIPGGWLATKIGGKRVFGYSMLGATIATLLTPVAAQMHYIVLLVLRIIVGITSGVAYPAMHSLWATWAPPLERSKLVSFTYAGAQVGNVITFPLAGLLCKYGFAGGWPSIFYILGVVSAIWCLLWMVFVSDSPAQHKRISHAEKMYILHSQKDTFTQSSDRKLNVPWCKIVTSCPVLAILVANITTDWSGYTLLTSIPTYMNEVLKLDISSNGLYSALPYIAFWIMITVTGVVADLIMSKGCCSRIITRKMFTIFGMLAPAISLVGLGYVDCTQPAVAIFLLVLGVSLSGVQYSGWIVNHMDIAPAFAGILFGICNSIAAVTGFLSPVVVGLITKDQTREQWQIVFYISALIYVVGAVVYGIFAEVDPQPWACDVTSIDVLAEAMPLKDTESQLVVNHDNGDVTEVTEGRTC